MVVEIGKPSSFFSNSLITATDLVTENEIEIEKHKIKNKLERRKKKQALVNLMKRIGKKKKSKRSTGEMISTNSIRTRHEEIYESYLKLLGEPYLINQIFCFGCGNFYQYGDKLKPPRKCQVCQSLFYVTGLAKKTDPIIHMCRPDFIMDFNNYEDRVKYKQDTQYHRVNKIKAYKDEYMKKVAVIRIDGGVHQKKRIATRDYHQYQELKELGVKLFIVQNYDIDELLSKNDNGKSLLQLCRNIGDAILDEGLYLRYTKSGDFKERTRKPF